MTGCKTFVETAEMLRGTNPCQNTIESLSRALHIAECCRSEGREDLVNDLLEKIEALPLAKDGAIAARIATLRGSATLPPLLIRGWNFASAMARHIASGMKRCSKKQINERLAICQACPNLVDNHCKLCGCACVAENQLMNKLALASEKCPIGKWE